MTESLKAAQSNVYHESVPIVSAEPAIRGYDFSDGINYDALFHSMKTVGAQATDFGRAIDEINRMLSWRLSHDPIMEDEAESDKDPKVRHETRAKIFLGYTSNMISCGTRETIRFLVKHKLVDVIVTTCGGIEEDFIKCMGDFQVGDFNLPGTVLRERGQNRIGNILVSNDLYCKFEEFMTPILLRMLKEQKEDKTVWSPSKMIHLMGEIINNPDSVYYWCYKNNIPVFCPAITDGAIGDNIFFFNDQHPGLVLDLVQDISLINWEALHAKKTGMIICGGGVIKHHIANANLMRNGADFSVYINTGNEKEASDTGASPDEAVSWGKITQEAKPVKVWGDFTILFPLIVSQTFAKSIYSPLSEDHRRMPVEENKEEKHE